MLVKVNGIEQEIEFNRNGYDQIRDILQSRGEIKNEYCSICLDKEIIIIRDESKGILQKYENETFELNLPTAIKDFRDYTRLKGKINENM